jgi:hypothetical protein
MVGAPPEGVDDPCAPSGIPEEGEVHVEGRPK